MSLSRPRPPSPNSTPWPIFSAQSSSSAPVDIHSPTRSPKKMKGRPRQERNAEEDIKFNVGPKSPRAMLARRLMRRARPERVIDPYTMDIPNYPPPSFQEATSGYSTSTLPVVEIADANENQTAFHQANEQAVDHHPVDHRTSPTFDSDSSSSDSSHDFCDVPGTQIMATQTPRRKKGKEHQRGLAFPSTPLRGRNKSRAMLHDDLEVEDRVAQPVASTRRHNSLSPLRTLFPSLHFTLHDRAASAHPTTEPANEPYPLSRGISSFFRSTTSLALLHGNGNTTPTSLNSKTSLTNLSSHGTSPKRKLFSPSKGKERERVERAERSERPEKVEFDPDTDQLDTWEVIDAADAVEASASSSTNKEGKNKEETRRNSHEATEVPIVDPFKRQGEAAHPAPVGVPIETPQPQSPPVQSQSPAVHPLSLRDRKAPIPPVDRTPRTPPQLTPLPQSVPPRPHLPPVIAPPPLRSVQSQDPSKPNSGPPITNARVTRKPTAGTTHTLTTKKSQVFNSSPLGIQTWRAGDESPTKAADNPAIGSEADSSLQAALETPLPPTPTDGVGSGLHDNSQPRSNTTFPNELQSVMAEIAGLQFEPSTDAFNDTLGCTSSGSETPTKKHYHGRPLPPAPVHPIPSTRIPIDSVYLTNSSHEDHETNREERTNCPEGLLIDLDDNTFVSGASASEMTRSLSDLFSPLVPPAPPTPLTATGNGHGHRGHLTPASMSTPNLASRPIYPSPLQLVSMTPDQGQASPRSHTWTPLYTMTTDSRWTYECGPDEEPPEYEALRFWARPPLSFPTSVKNVPPSPHLTHHVGHVPPFALALARAQTHPAASSGVVPVSLHANGR
ncbi:hypothetical protein APHAL10511_006690 [Amanita phalloides]|nr:hypothetical protein APHAL10511_006690 [Amanita phalloides]